MAMKSEVEMDLIGDQRETESPPDVDMPVQSSDMRSSDRGVWANKLEFFLAITGYTVGLGSVWRFPIICSRNGGGAFLIPFFFFLITSGGPLYYLEVCLGQFTGKSAGLAFEFCPLLKLPGLGLLQVVLSLTVLWYLMIILAWVLYFIYSSLQPELPWTTCHNEWNTNQCKAIAELWSSTNTEVHQQNLSFANESDSFYFIGVSSGNQSIAYRHYNASTVISNLTTNKTTFSSSAFEYWEYHVIGRSRGLDDMGTVQLHLVVCFFLAWVFCVAAVIKGVKSLGKVVYVTATAPYVGLTIMFIKGLTLDGAMDGINMYIQPEWSKLLSAQVWMEAAVQVFFSLGPSWGGVITMSSYNKFHDKSFWSSTMCVVSAGFTAFYNGLVVFTLLGFMAKSSGVPLQEVASQSGPGLAFVVFPTVLFFFVLLTATFDSLFGMLETVTSAFIDFFPHRLIRHRAALNIIGGLCFFILELPLTMNGGIYLMQLADWYFSQFALLFCSFLELVAVCWIYGMDRFAQDIHMMIGRDVCVILRVTWAFLIPFSVLLVFCTMLSQYSAPQYGDGYIYSSGAVVTGIFIGLVPIFVMIGTGIFTFLKLDGSIWQRLWKGLTPSKHWIPHDQGAEQLYKSQSYKYPDTCWKNYLAVLIEKDYGATIINYSRTCLKRPAKGERKPSFLRQVVS